MKRRYTLTAKTVAFMLCIVTLTLCIAAVAGVWILAESDGYSSTAETVVDRAADRKLASYTHRVASLYRIAIEEGWSVEYFDYYGGTNFFYIVRNSDGVVLGDTSAGRNAQYSIHYEFVGGDITGCIAENLVGLDEISLTLHMCSFLYRWRYALIVIFFGALLLHIICVVFLFGVAGHRMPDGKVVPIVFDRIPFDLFTAFFAVIGVIAVLLLGELDYAYWYAWVILCLSALAGDALLLAYGMSFIVRVKLGTLLRNTLLWRICVLLLRFLRAVGRWFVRTLYRMPVLWKTYLMLLLALAWSGISAFSLWEGGTPILWIFGWAVLFVLVPFYAWNMRRLLKGSERIAAGDFESRLDTSGMFPSLRRHADVLNRIRDGMSRAVEEKIRSERFRTELITNVSHDLKTPLTSIVNYVGLIKQEPIENETLRGYIDVLDRQSGRLRKLTEDLIEVSKASTGNLETHPAPCALRELIAQVSGEYEDRLHSRDLTWVVTFSEAPLTVIADGRHLWRVLDNLMSNICKYAQVGTRVYLSVERIGGRVVLTFRNISALPLSGEVTDWTERFVRGDTSRHVEGSGLGLSIAKSLTELQGGTLVITTDGDLFKVVLSFPAADTGASAEIGDGETDGNA